MTGLPELKTAQLALRPRQLADLDAIATMNADPEVMRYIAPLGDPAMSRDGIAARSFSHIARGLGYWSVFPATEPGALIGYVGLIPDGEAQQQVQLSYRFAARHWGQGHGFEAVSRLLRHGFETLALPEIVIVTHPQNLASLRLAAKLGFKPAPRQVMTLIGAPPVVATRLRLERPREQKREPY
ncbi:GNAT family N-acetyltransferase [Bosea vaviloviae]|nr:GNAT family N-acetyltransferase [Bosea vaviloviae]